MIEQRRKGIIIGIIFIILISMGSGISYNTDTQAISTSAEKQVQEITSNVVIEQEFTAQKDHLKEITLFFGTYGRNNTSKLKFEIIQEDKVLDTSVIQTNDLENNKFFSIAFNVKEKIEGEQVKLRISSDAEIGNGITLWYNTSQVTNDDEKLIANDQVLEGNLVMEVGYKRLNFEIQPFGILINIIIVFTVLYSIFYMVKFKYIENLDYVWKIFALSIISTISLLIISENSIKALVNIVYNEPIIFGLNGLIIFGILLLSSLILSKHNIGLYVGWTALVAISIGSWVKLQLKGEPFLPWDIFSIKEGLMISKENNIFEHIAIKIVLVAAIPYYYIYKIKIKDSFRRRAISIVATSLGITLLFTQVIWNPSMIKGKLNIDNIIWNQKNNLAAYKLPLITAMNSQYLNIDKPEQYSQENILEVIEGNLPEGMSDKSETPNIIVIMNESWADLRNISSLGNLDEVMSNLDDYKDKSLYGWTYSSVIGGGTANSEYEVLTGQAVKFLPPAAIAYPMYVDDETFAITKFLKESNYYNVAIHPYIRTFWNREQVYQDFEFDRYYSDNITESPEIRNGYIADLEVLDKIKEVYENKGEQPLFCFAVTMQNHQPYDNVKGYSELVDIPTGIFEKDVETVLEVYLTGVRDANELFVDLADYVDTLEESTIVLMFGDHYPPLGEKVYEALLGKAWSEITREELVNFYTTPFIAYKNYDVESKDMGKMSMFYLLPQIFEESDIIMPDYFKILNNFFESSKGYTPQFIFDSEGKLLDKMPESMKAHELLQYNNLKGKNYYYDELFR